MAKDKKEVEGLEDAATQSAVETAEKKEKKVKTAEEIAEEKNMLAAGVAKLRAIGVSDKLSSVLELVAEWPNADKETLAPMKEKVIEAFGGSEKLKDYFGGEFQQDVLEFAGIAKAMPVLNNIKAFYARRENTGTKKVKTIQVSISGTIYNVSADYSAEIANLPGSERKQLLLAHPDTVKVNLAEEII